MLNGMECPLQFQRTGRLKSLILLRRPSGLTTNHTIDKKSRPMQPRFRMFAGPNGSGKTVLFTHLRNKSYIHTELYVSADRIEQDLKFNHKFFFSSYRVRVTENEFKEYIRTSGLYQKLSDTSFLDCISIKSGVLMFGNEKNLINSYVASFIATYLCEKLFSTGQSFCFETVLSHPSKFELFEKRKMPDIKPICISCVPTTGN
jgi:predicted ABC-type ATPase